MPPNIHRMRMPQWFLVFFALLTSMGCEKQPSSQPVAEAQPTKVSIASPTMRRPIETRRYSGRLQADQRVEVRARVKGYLDQVLFQEGTEVTKGAELYVIDPRTFQAEVDDARADFERLEAEYWVATQDALRSSQLQDKKAVSAEEHDHRIATKAISQAALARGQARLDTAMLNMGFTRITAPINGRAGRTLVTAGNLVGQSEPTLLTTIVQMDPLHLVFEVTESDLISNWGRLGNSTFSLANSPSISVRFGLDTDEGTPYEVIVDFRDTEVNPGTGTVLLRAVVPNGNRLFSPGMFARVEVLFSQSEPAPHVPESSVFRDQQGHYVFTVGSDNKVQRQRVATWPSYDGLIAIRKGLTASDRTIVSGVAKLVPGTLVAAEVVELNQVLVAKGDRP